ncbi:hypothetical protein [Desulforamulus aquiferis]|uniref:Uncharacterized protein n=1 Tax=Desulforamulus aquiferis TaxID=1397668 RepID=A0AAW7Z9Q8_9FIRM|nr:hypothetical protein [Desulforamulus aquiferis]MDO7785811.1 hypothetical protein [Desulforamulus aquiferis]
MSIRKIVGLIILIYFTTLPAMAEAQVIFDDDFNDTSYIDTIKTSAYVDTANSYVRLPRRTMPNAIAMLKYGEGYAVTSSDGIIISEYDDATGALHDTKIPWLTNTRGLSIRQDNMNLWVIGEDFIQYCQFSGGIYSDDPALKSSGMADVLSVGAIEGTDKAVVLKKSATGKTRITRYSAGAGLTVELDKELDIGEPKALAVVDGTPDIVIVTNTGKYYLMFDDAAQDYVVDPARYASGLTDVASVSANQGGVTVLDNNEGRFLSDNDAGGVQQVLAYSAGVIHGGLAVSIKPGAYDQAFITETGEIRYYVYDDATDSMKRLSDMEKTGIQLSAGYEHPKEYYSKVITTIEPFDEIKLTAENVLPNGTEIKYYISSDAGLTWTEIANGTWTTIPSGTQFVARAVLDTNDNKETPKILRIKMEVSKLELLDLEIRAIAYNKAGQPLPITTFPAVVRAGAEVQFEVTTRGFAQNVYSTFSTGHNVTLIPTNPITSDENTWRGLYTVPPDLEDGSTVGITVTAERGSRQKQLTLDPFIRVEGSVLFEVDLSLKQ